MKFSRTFVEEDLAHEERLALAWLRLNRHEWDSYVGPKPDGFDGLPDYGYFSPFSEKEMLSKSYYVRPVMTVIEENIGTYALQKFLNDYLSPNPIKNFDQWYFSVETLKIARRELFPKVYKPPLLWHLRQKVRQWRHRA